MLKNNNLKLLKIIIFLFLDCVYWQNVQAQNSRLYKLNNDNKCYFKNEKNNIALAASFSTTATLIMQTAETNYGMCLQKCQQSTLCLTGQFSKYINTQTANCQLYNSIPTASQVCVPSSETFVFY